MSVFDRNLAKYTPDINYDLLVADATSYKDCPDCSEGFYHKGEYCAYHLDRACDVCGGVFYCTTDCP